MGPLPPDEAGRLAALDEMALDASPDGVLDGLAQAAADLLGWPVSSVNIVDARRQWVKAAVGAERGSGPAREDSFCTHVVAGDADLVVEDARCDPRFAGHAPVRDAALLAYAGVPMRTEDGHVVGSFCVWGPEPRTLGAQDRATLGALAAAAAGHLELRRRTRQLDTVRRELRAVLEHAPDAFIAMDDAGVVCDWNLEAERLFGWPRALAVGQRVSELIIPERLRAAHGGGLDRYRRTGELTVLNRPVEVPAVHRDGHEVQVELRIAAVSTGGGRRFNAFARDIGVRRAMEAEQERLLRRLEELSRTDPLTGAANRRCLDDALRRETARAGRTGEPLSVIALDLDHFKAYNDEHGHAAGDALLHGCVAAWRAILRATDLLARAGGEEFVVVLPSCGADAAAAIAERLNVLVPGGRSCSGGVAEWDGEEPVTTLLDRADRALYAAKAAGRSTVCLA
jgi:diguanylate cyclase (GGDEF)-like protein/PAS domain S-box-containing protein